MGFETIVFDLASGVARLTLNRPDRLNSFTVQMHGEVAEALGRVVRSLLDNAFRHGKPPVAITIGRRDGRIQLEVSDAGTGLPQGSEERIFERFYRADPARSGEGTGLGLSIAQAIVKSHGGTIRAANIDGGGTTVTIELPAL